MTIAIIIPINATKTKIQLSIPTEIILQDIQLSVDQLSLNDHSQKQTITKGIQK